MNRKDFIRVYIRYLLISIIGILSGLALYNGRNVNAAMCPENLACSNCAKKKQCTLPEKSAYDRR